MKGPGHTLPPTLRRARHPQVRLQVPSGHLSLREGNPINQPKVRKAKKVKFCDKKYMCVSVCVYTLTRTHALTHSHIFSPK